VKTKASQLFAVLVIIALLAGCAPAPAPAPVVVKETVVVEKVVAATQVPVKKALVPFGVQQSWKNDAQSAPLHVAMMAGYYAEEGLDVKLVEGGPGVNGALNTLAGRNGIYVGFEAGDIDLIPERVEGNMPFVIIGALMQKKPEAYITLAKNVPSGVKVDPSLMKGKKIGVGGAENYKLEALLAQAGLTLKDVTPVRIDVSSVQALSTGLVDWANGWVINQTFDIEQTGAKWEALVFADWGVPMHGNVMYTTEERIRKEPALIAAFVRATLRGVQRCIDDPEYAVQASLKLGGGYDTPEKARYVITGMNKLAVSDATKAHGLGWVDKERVMSNARFLNKYTGIPVPPNVDAFVDMQFVEAANKK